MQQSVLKYKKGTTTTINEALKLVVCDEVLKDYHFNDHKGKLSFENLVLYSTIKDSWVNESLDEVIFIKEFTRALHLSRNRWAKKLKK